jgi:predicted MPP superfamily phosphohydrolase
MGRSLVVALFALLHAYIGWRLLPDLLSWPLAWGLLAALLVLSFVMMPVSLIVGRRRATPFADALTWIGMLLMGLFSSLLVLTVLRDVGLALLTIAHKLQPGLSPGNDVAIASAMLVPVAAIAITALGLLNARRTAAVVRVDVPIAGLPGDLHGFTIAQITDIHVGPTIKRPYVQAIVESVNRLNADMVAVTGDLVDGSVAELADHVAPIAQLSSRPGTFFVTGNHEYYSDAHAWIDELRRLDVRVLLNEHVVLQHRQGALIVAGVTDHSGHHFDPSHRSDPRAALAGAPPDVAFKLLLAHQPRSASAAADAGFQLQLSGHTHGGQFLPWNFLVRLQQPFTAGLHRLRELWVYTSKGTGYWGPPKRFGVPSEITFLRLVRQAA